MRRQIVPQARSGGLVPPTWTGLKGKLFHVASGGGRRMDDPVSPTDPATVPQRSRVWSRSAHSRSMRLVVIESTPRSIRRRRERRVSGVHTDSR